MFDWVVVFYDGVISGGVYCVVFIKFVEVVKVIENV